MSSLEGSYKSNFDSFSIRISKISDEYSFWRIVSNDKEILLYKGKLNFNTDSQLIIIFNDDITISPKLDYSIISINKFPQIGYIGNYSQL